MNLYLLSYYVPSCDLIRTLKLTAPWFPWWGNRKGKVTIITIIGYLTCVCYFNSSTLKVDLQYSHQRREKWGLQGGRGRLRNWHLNKDLSSLLISEVHPQHGPKRPCWGVRDTGLSTPSPNSAFTNFSVLATHWTSSLALAFLFSTMGMPAATLPAHILLISRDTTRF